MFLKISVNTCICTQACICITLSLIRYSDLMSYLWKELCCWAIGMERRPTLSVKDLIFYLVLVFLILKLGQAGSFPESRIISF